MQKHKPHQKDTAFRHFLLLLSATSHPERSKQGSGQCCNHPNGKLYARLTKNMKKTHKRKAKRKKQGTCNTR